jgi:hypothetical protein
LDRFLASLSEEVDDSAAFAAWIDRMQTLDQDARRYEIAILFMQRYGYLRARME